MGYIFSLSDGIVEENKFNNNLFLAINWNIIGRCFNECLYCYGVDIRYFTDPSKTVINSIIKGITKISPNLLILSGGEPLLVNGLPHIIQQLLAYNFDIILDTSAVIPLNQIPYDILKNIHIRISIDSSDNSLNEFIRSSSVTDSTSVIKSNISYLIDNKLPMTIQTTISPYNLQNLFELGLYLSSISVRNWRLNIVIPHDDLFEKMCLSEFQKLCKVFPHMKIRISNTREYVSSHIVLVDPIGHIYVRNSFNNDKQCIGNLITDNIKSSNIFKYIDVQEHIKRYMF